MSSKTETIAQTSRLLQSLSVGAMITLTQGGRQANVLGIGTQLAIAMSATHGFRPIFVITMYGSNGANQAKIALQPMGMDGYYWIAGQNVSGLMYPVLVGTDPGHFLLTDNGAGNITIQKTSIGRPPGPYVHGYDPDLGIQILTYGHDAPLVQGIFNIQVVG